MILNYCYIFKIGIFTGISGKDGRDYFEITHTPKIDLKGPRRAF
jgi:hypothetical protein